MGPLQVVSVRPSTGLIMAACVAHADIIFLPCGFFYLCSFMAALCNREGRIYFHPVVSSSFFFSSPNLIGRRLDVYCLPYFHAWCGLSVNLECRSETCCARLAENTARKKSSKSRRLGTIPQLCRAISLQLRQVSKIGKKS